jgi:TatD DNase family protein
VIEFFDTHAHIQELEFRDDFDSVLQSARAAGVGTIVMPAEHVESSASATRIAERYANLYATAGYHPNEASSLTPEALAAIDGLLAHPKVVAVGEIGLDFYRDHATRDQQYACLDQMLELAERHHKPIVVHCRDAWPELRPVIEPWARRVASSIAGPIGVLHYFSSTIDDALFYKDLGFMVSIHTSVTHPKAQALRDVVTQIPLEALVIETDAPYGAPQVRRGKRNEPALVVESAKQIAALKDVSLEDVAAITTANARRLFGLLSNDMEPPAKLGHGAIV